MTRKPSRRKPGAPKKRSPVPAYRRPVAAIDSEDEAGTYAPRNSPDDTGESDDGFLARSPAIAGVSHPKKKKEAVP
jgi:hypothetical protein